MYDIMIVEDDDKIASMLLDYIRKYGYNGFIVDDFDLVLDRFHTRKPHMVLLDINLPSYDGYYWCRQIRAVSACPIIVISARNGKMDQLMALENGADDYMTKPFHYEIVMAKIRNQLRRAHGDFAVKERVIRLSGLLLYPERMELHLNGKSVAMSKKETVLLETLIERSPRIVSREVILDKLWDDTFVDDNTLSVNITRIRKRLADLGIEHALETVRGTGYRLNPVWADEEAR
ncbi:response regulator transcription factor [Paenibacillus sp. CGMCC 1.16610]|uniref:Response regulator n=1 Tax=Paenibacillus anseongense TaxID=2682845 RepID=A0ABW9U7Z1_9BACL|nr:MULTISPECIES: response regulator transcription factor [Paenibacillus]MBA2937165.1 response regulator transcription factor [Paenibacillus sp. CGMCC 1.16610]MVQ36227.1 response regulator [Paenibacillus anseongense]